MKNRILNNWNWIRVVRLILGLAILVSGIGGKDNLAIIIGAIFTLLPIFNISTCATGGCSSGNCGIDLTKTNNK